MDYDILIIGGGSAGLSSAIYAKRAGKNVAVIEKIMVGGQLNLIGEIENYLGFEKIDGMELAQKFKSHAKSFGMQIINGEVSEVDLNGKEKIVKCGDKVYTAKAVILALGSHPRELKIHGEEEFKGMGVSYCAVCDGNFFRDKTVAVVGSGDSAFKDAIYLSSLCKKVYLLTKDNLKMHNYAQNELQKNGKIIVKTGAISQEILGDKMVSGLRYVQDGKEETIPVSAVFVAIGRTPSTEFLKGQIDLDEKGYILTDEKMKTSLDGVYACGDARKSVLKQIATCVGEGAIAGTMACEYVNGVK